MKWLLAIVAAALVVVLMVHNSHGVTLAIGGGVAFVLALVLGAAALFIWFILEMGRSMRPKPQSPKKAMRL